ncbi:MAG: efflux RND transporter permease subunit, partial [Bdellovibrionales bacterium]|nr:efflux RND transporter permease subunit [Bdellovibrionales bacterium]
LKSVTEENPGTSPTQITRIDRSRAVIIQGDLAQGAALGEAIQKMTVFMQKFLPAGYTLNFLGQAKSLKELGLGALVALGLAVLFIYMIMASLYESLIIPFSILLTLPLAIIGAFSALLMFGKMLDVYTIIGIILLMGLVTKNAILLVDYAEQLRKDGVERTQALITAGERRLRPIMMTSVAMIAGFLPVAAGIGEINAERSGMGTAAIGGMISSTALSLIVVPVCYIYLDNFRNWMRKKLGRKHA